jgi:RNA polymerase sigma factor (sigma-70 family)
LEDFPKIKELDRTKFISWVYQAYGKKLYSYSISTWRVNEDIAWSLVYKTIWKIAEVHQNYTFEKVENFTSFIFKIFINYLKNHYRDNKSQSKDLYFDLAQVEMSNSETETDNISENKKLTALNEELEEMEEWERLLLLLRSEGRPYSEIAIYVDKPEKQLKVYYQRLKLQISKKLHDRF